MIDMALFFFIGNLWYDDEKINFVVTIDITTE